MKTKSIDGRTKNKNATLADGVFEAAESTRLGGPRLGMGVIIARSTCLSSEERRLVDKGSLKPAEGIEPSVPRIPSLRPHHAAGYQKLYHVAPHHLRFMNDLQALLAYKKKRPYEDGTSQGDLSRW